MANGGVAVSGGGGELSLGGAEPINQLQMSVGHHDQDLEISSRLQQQEGIGTADGDRRRQAVEETRSGHNV